ncbi:MAG: sulfite oxidase-like oxidoreductase [Planctomycetaceae bacterium]|nr:sulfite oxidase-like oxidoreductase [Planctomycetaceae bacterium]
MSSDPIRPMIVSSDTEREQRIPPGQVLTRKWPVLHAGSTPQVDLTKWDLRLFGLVKQPARWTWDEFRALPSVDVRADMHCVTRWSRLSMTWHGVLVSEVMKHVELLPEARFVVAHCEQSFTTNLPIEWFLAEDALFAWGADGTDLSPDHGWPLRLVVPKLYAWKSAKWLCGVEFLAHDQPGYWERGGYHMRGDPWLEERFGAW